MLRLLIIMLIPTLGGISWTDYAVAQNSVQNLKTVSRQIFTRLNKGDANGLKNLVTENIEVFDSTYPLKIEGWTELYEYVADLRENGEEVDTSIHQMTVRILGTAAVVNFYYTEAYGDIDRPATRKTGRRDAAEDEFIAEEWMDEVGRATIVYTQEMKAWKAVTVHLSLFLME